MSDEIIIAGKQYSSSKRASEMSGYAQDYVGQLARSGFIDSQRVGGLWYVDMDSLISYKDKAEIEKRKNPPAQIISKQDAETLVSFDGREYISAGRASKVSGYNQDYVGQLARSGKVASNQIGNRWYVERASLLKHKKEKDALLAEVQSESVGLHAMNSPGLPVHKFSEDAFYTYHSGGRKDLFPAVEARESYKDRESRTEIDNRQVGRVIPVIPVKIRASGGTYPAEDSTVAGRPPGAQKRKRYVSAAAFAFTVIIILSVGLGSLKKYSILTVVTNHVTTEALHGTSISAAAAAEEAYEHAVIVLESLLTKELAFRRGLR